MSQRKLKTLSLEQRVEVLRLLNQNETQTSIAVTFGVGQAVISRIKKNAEEILTEWKSNKNPNRKRKRNSTAEDLDNALLKWFDTARCKQLPVNGPLLKVKAKQLGEELGLPNFKVSNGWLERWKTRNGIKFKILNGEKQDLGNFRMMEGVTENSFEQCIEPYIETYGNSEYISKSLLNNLTAESETDSSDVASHNCKNTESSLLTKTLVENGKCIQHSPDIASYDGKIISSLLLHKTFAEDSSNVTSCKDISNPNSFLHKALAENKKGIESPLNVSTSPTLVDTLQAMDTVREYLKINGCSSYDSFYKLQCDIIHLSEKNSIKNSGQNDIR